MLLLSYKIIAGSYNGSLINMLHAYWKYAHRVLKCFLGCDFMQLKCRVCNVFHLKNGNLVPIQAQCQHEIIFAKMLIALAWFFATQVSISLANDLQGFLLVNVNIDILIRQPIKSLVHFSRSWRIFDSIFVSNIVDFIFGNHGCHRPAYFQTGQHTGLDRYVAIANNWTSVSTQKR